MLHQGAGDQRHGAQVVLAALGTGARERTRREGEPDTRVHADAERQAIGAGTVGCRAVRVVIGGVRAEDRGVTVGGHQVDADQVVGRHLLARGQVHRAGRPPAGGRARRVQAHTLVDRFLQEHGIRGVALGIVRVAGAPAEDIVYGMRQRVDRGERTPEETARLLRILRTFGKAATLGQALGNREDIRAEIRQALEEFDEDFFQPSMARRRGFLEQLNRGEIAEDALPRDVLMDLLRSEADTRIDADVLMKEIGFFLLAGAFTTVHTLVHAVHDLFTWRAQHPEDAALYANDVLFLQKAMHESMRLHPSSPTAGRRPTCPVHLPTGQDATPDDLISVDLMSANRDCAIFGADAGEYNPLRPAPRGASPYGLSFGMGMHSCIGLNLAAGMLPRADTQPDGHQLGTVTLIVRALLAHGARPDPEHAGVVDHSTIRHNWSSYPLLLDAG